ncbi:uncharacterized protein [Parasteatoda tepidariorum]|uniref:uncharacterized protein isoform X1 n=2 Tax=Parasteatoda tepidariorum TaxID=114398 RepID=UPI001C71E20D|nr:uncharacterized protein LOC107447411 isoform X1 [Parasteatoda tepidariorum]
MTHQTNHATSVACFATSFVMEGIQRCSGIFFSWTLDQSEDSRQKAAVPFVVARATAYIVSVVFKDFLRNQSVENSLQCGIFLGILGTALSYISSDFIWMTICWGIIFGAGIGISSPEPLKVSQKFRTQPFLFLICCAAPSFACILLPYFIQFLLSCYGLCGCLLILSGIAMNAAPFIMVASYRIRFQLWRIRKKYEINDIESQKTSEDNECFEMETSSMPAQPDSCIVEKNSISRKTTLPHKNSNLLPIQEANKEIQIPSRKNTGLVPKGGAAHEKDFSEEDVLFELNSSALRNQNCSGCRNTASDDTISCRSRKATIRINPLPSVNSFSNKAFSNDDEHDTGAAAEKLHNALLIDSTTNLPNNGILRNKESDTPRIHTSTHQGDFLVVKTPLSNSYPLEIKVHVVECTFTEDDVRDGRLLTQSVPNIKKGGYRRHSNSLITSQYNNINFSSPNFSKKYSKPSNLYGRSSNPSPNMYLISEDDELAVDSPSRNNDAALSSAAVGQQKSQTMSSLKKIFKPTCLVVIYAFVIHEVTLVTLLTIFDDHIDGLVSPATGVLPAFGLGGILGRLSVKYWGDRLLLEGSHATSALLFILDGVVVAGILWSPNIYWIGGFYATLGFLEIGISTAVWNLVSDHIEVDTKSALFTACKLLCGICSLFVPYTIGLSRDVMGEYDGLLQITSGLSVLCAILCYILPKFSFHVKHTRGS